MNDLEFVLKEAVSECRAKQICFSGGLDSSIIAYFLQGKKVKATTIISKDFVATDLTYCQLVTKEFNIPLQLEIISSEELLSGIEETIKILKNFNDIEIRNSVVMYLALKSIKKQGGNAAITGDGADELFAGYNFFLNKDQESLQKDLERIWNIMHFPTNEIGKVLQINVESPFLNEKVIKFAKKVPAKFKVRKEGDKKYGKWILRKTFERKLPSAIVWRKKSPMQDGAGTASLTNLFASIISDQVFETSVKQIKEKDDVIIRSKESLHYYNIFKKYYDSPNKLHSSKIKCPFCQYEITSQTKFCRMCGSFPI